MRATVSMPALILGILAVWRVTHLFWGEDGPWGVLARLRRTAGHGILASLLDCFYCLSLWVAAPAAWALGSAWMDRALLWLALSGGACLLERMTAERVPAAPAAWHLEPLPDSHAGEFTTEESDDVLLRKSEVRSAP